MAQLAVQTAKFSAKITVKLGMPSSHYRAESILGSNPSRSASLAEVVYPAERSADFEELLDRCRNRPLGKSSQSSAFVAAPVSKASTRLVLLRSAANGAISSRKSQKEATN